VHRIRPAGRARVRAAVPVLAGVLALGLAACGAPGRSGGDDGAAGATSTTAAGATTTTTTSDDGGVPVVADPPVLDPPTRPGGDGPIGPDLPDVPAPDDDDGSGPDDAGVTLSDGDATTTTRPGGTTGATSAPAAASTAGAGTGPAVGTGTVASTTTTTAGDGHRQVSVLALQVGMCFLDPGRGAAGQPTEVATLEVVPCEEEHDHEVVALWNDPAGPGAPFPGRAALVAGANCLWRLAEYAAVDPLAEALDALPITPEAATWAQGDRAVGCYAHRFDGTPTTGSLRAEA
jgi:hypothetical protein